MTLTALLAIVITFLIYSLICFYIGYNGWVWIKPSLYKYKWIYIGLNVFLAASIFLGQFISWMPLELLGGFWMVVVGYSLIVLPIANLVYYILKKRGIHLIGFGILAFYMFIFIYGSFNAWIPVVRTYDITVEKSSDIQDLKILMASDLHLGPIVGERHLQRLVDLTIEVKPDIVFIPGDIIENNIGPFIEENMGATMKKIKAPLGVYAVPGNHDYYGDDIKVILAEMKKAGIEFMKDETILIEDSFYIVGRKDRTDRDRLQVKELVKGVDQSKPLIMMDHQPYELDIAKDNGIDVVLSGHTHRGQLAPANLITNMIYENDWGYLQKESLHSFVSSGFGHWGPPLRIGSRAEVFEINIKFQK